MDSTEKPIKKAGVLFWILWLAGTSLAWSIFLAVTFSTISPPIPFWLFGLLQGGLQWLVLRPYIRRSIWWLVIGVVGSLLPIFFIQASLTWGANLAVYLLSTTLAEWALLSVSMRKATWWWIIKLVALIIPAVILPVFYFFFAVGFEDNNGVVLYWAIIGLVAGAVFGLVTGLGLWMLLKGPAKALPAAPAPHNYRRLQTSLLILMAVILVLLPLYSFFKTYSLQNRLYCQTLKIGSNYSDIQGQLAQIQDYSASRLLFMGGNENVPYPPQLKNLAGQANEFYEVSWNDALIDIPKSGLAVDKNGALLAYVLETRNGFQNFQVPQCPWTFQSAWDSLFGPAPASTAMKTTSK